MKKSANKAVIISSVLLVFAVILYYFYTQTKNPSDGLVATDTLTPTVFTTPTLDINKDRQKVTEIVKSFYQNYDDCMKNPPAKAKGQVSIYCQNNSGLTTPDFQSNLDEGGTSKAGADPIYCAQNPAESVSVDDVKISGNQSTGLISETFGEIKLKDIKVELLNNGESWKIDNLICPKP